MAEPWRPLLYSEGASGTGILGHMAVDAALRAGLASVEGVEARFCGPGPLSRAERRARGAVPLLFGVGLDLQPTRWHLVQSRRARRAIRGALAEVTVDALLVNSHTSGLLLGAEMRALPTYLSVDASIWAWERLGVWSRVRPWTRTALAGSLALERRALTQAAGVVAWSAWSADGVRSTAPGAHVHQVHPGVDLSRFRPAARAPRDRTRVLFVGGRFEQKGGPELLEAVGPFLGRGVELDLVTAATPPARPGLRVHHLGPGDPRLVALMQQADVLCLPSRGDAVPLTVVEAMACGTPVVASATGAVPELLGDGEAGVVVPVGDVECLRATIVDLLGDPARCATLGAAARRRAERRYDARRQAVELISVMRARS